MPYPKKNWSGYFVHLLRNGTLFYWSSFFILVIFEFYIGGKLSVLLTKDNYATYISVLNTLPFYTVITNLGISYGIIYIISYNKNIGFTVFRQGMQLQTVWYAILIMMHIAAYYFVRNIYAETLMIACIISYTYAHRVNCTSYFLANRNFSKAALSNLLQKTLLLIAFSIIPLTNLSGTVNNSFPSTYVAIECSVVLFYFMVFSKTMANTFANNKQNYRKRLLKYGKYAFANNGLNVLYYTIIAFIIRSSKLDIHIQIILGLCIVFFRYTAVAIAPIFSTMTPEITNIKNNPAKVQNHYKKYLWVTALLSLATLLACRYMFSIFINNFYAPSYHDLPEYFNFFSYLVPLLFFSSFNGSVLAALGRIKFTTWVELFCSALLLAFVVYNYFEPITDYLIVLYMILFHLCVKFILLNYGAYKNIKLG